MDTRTPEQRRRIMQSVHSKDTGPEMFVRRLLFRSGFRFRVHRKDLPGTPDIVFSGRRKAIFVHGCYWHGHGCKKGQPPKSGTAYWSEKIAKNRERDSRKQAELEALGWKVLTVWQCELVASASLERELKIFLGKPKFRSTSG
jgi:DNA mismatch endonuclease, patch repair protein